MAKMNDEVHGLEMQKSKLNRKFNNFTSGAVANNLFRINIAPNATLNDIQYQYQMRLKQLSDELNNRTIEVANTTNAKYGLSVELATLNAKLEALKKECADLEIQSNCESLNNLLDYLTKKLSSKEQELKNLQQEKSFHKTAVNFSNLSVVENNSRNINESTNDISVMQNKIELDRVFEELENLKIEITNEMKAENYNSIPHEVEEHERHSPLAISKEAYASVKYDRDNRNKKAGSISQIPGVKIIQVLDP